MSTSVQKFKLLSRQKLHATRVKIVRVNVRFSFSSFNEANVNRKIYSIGWNGPLPQRKKAFSSFSSFYNRHHRDRKWPISARVELVKLCLTYTPAIS